VADRLRRAIIFGELAAGERVKAEELAGRYAVSPTPLREAFQRLRAEGLLIASPNRSWQVAALSPIDMAGVYAARTMLEPLALRLSLRNGTSAWQARASELLHRLGSELDGEKPDPVSLEEAHEAFHSVLFSSCPAVELLEINRSLRRKSLRYRLQSLGPRGGPQLVLDEHQQLYQTCVDGHVELASELLSRHILLTIESLGVQQDDAEARQVLDEAKNLIGLGPSPHRRVSVTPRRLSEQPGRVAATKR
jgi:DNA-binding GntR family transcriptional regulator